MLIRISPELKVEIDDLLVECSCFIGFIKGVEENDKMLDLPSIVSKNKHKNKRCQSWKNGERKSWTPSDKTFCIRECYAAIHFNAELSRSAVMHDDKLDKSLFGRDQK